MDGAERRMLTSLPHDCQRAILSFFDVKELLVVDRVDKAHRCIIRADDFAERYALEYFASHAKEQHKIRIRQPFQLLSKFGRFLLEGKVSELARTVVDVSSVDRSEESPENVLTQSRCYSLLERSGCRADGGEFCQLYCGCAYNSSCYWSSRPTEDGDSTEFLTFQLRFPTSIIVGFYVWPYQAFFHPDSPIYGPREVSLQLLLPPSPNSVSDGRPLNMRLLPKNFSRAPIDLQANVYYQSPFYPMTNVRESHCFVLPQAVLNLGGEVRLLFRGMHQRQPGTAMQLTSEDFFICISRADILGIAIENFQAGFVDEIEADQELIVQPRSRPILQQATFLPSVPPAVQERFYR